MSRRFVSEHRAEFPTQRLCELVGVPRSSFYAWSSRPLSDHYLGDVDLAVEIFEIHTASRRTYGAPRVAGQLHNRGRHHGTKRVARIMAECGCGASGCRLSTKSQADLLVWLLENLADAK